MLSFEPQTSVAERITQLRRSLPASVRLIAVSKQVSVELIRQAYAAGVRDFGESRVQEAIAKQAQLQDLTDITWHLIGHLQGNKAKAALHTFGWIHSLDSLKLAQQLNDLATRDSQPAKVLVQVKLVSDPDKYGWTVPDLLATLPRLAAYSYLCIHGLMVILPLGLSPAQQLATFEQAQQLREQIRQQKWGNMPMQELSMGMSEDYHLAVQAGATMVRLGRTIFGSRS